MAGHGAKKVPLLAAEVAALPLETKCLIQSRQLQTKPAVTPF